MHARLVAFAVLAGATSPTMAWAQQASPQSVACHDQATRKYIADFRQVGPRRIAFEGRGTNIVTVFQNENPRYEDYFADCMKQQDESGKAR